MTTLENLNELETAFNNYRLNYDDAINDLCNIAYDLGRDDLVEDFITIETAEEIAKHELERGGLSRLYYFMGDVNFVCCGNFVRLNGYGNLTEIYREDIKLVIDELKSELE